MEQPLVSVILCVYNGERFLGETIRSVLDQTYRNLELVIVDDASTDGTPEIIRGFDDPRIVAVRNDENQHISFSTNRGIFLAKGQYIAIIDSDDRWLPEKTEKQVSWLEKHPETGFCFTWAQIVDENGRPLGEEAESWVKLFRQENRSREQWLHDLILQGNCLCHPSVMYRREALEAIGPGPYDITLAQLMDFEIYLRLLEKTEIHILTEELVLCRRVQEENHSNSAVSLGGNLRLWNENGMVLTGLIRRMPEGEFFRIFDAELTTHPADSRLLKYEKGMLLYQQFQEGGIRRDGLAMVRECMLDPENYALLREKAGLNQKQFFSLNTFEDERQRMTEHHAKVQGEIIDKQQGALRELNQAVADKDQLINAMQNSFFWRIMNPARKAAGVVRKGLEKHPKMKRVAKGVKSLLTAGPKATLQRIPAVKQRSMNNRQLNRRSTLTTKERKQQEAERFPKEITFSILVPLYNTPMDFLKAMIRSVTEQTYSKWELCLADGSDDDHGEVGEYCRSLAAKDGRIKYRKLEENKGISGNTNACIEMATGDYIALFDHDDLLHPAALYEVMKAICEQDADFIYTDENTFHDTPKDAYQPHFKPDFAPDTLRANNYICHLTVFRKDLLEKAGGGFRSEFDGSQDFDLVLRLTEQAERIVHIPKILYYWRAHKGSVAESVSAKPYVVDAAKRAIAEHLERVGLEGEVLDSVVPSMYRLKYRIHGNPLISILIPNMDHVDDLRRCINSIRNLSTWTNYEIIIIENNSEDPTTFDCYRDLKRDPRIRVVEWKGKFNYSAINNFGFQAAKGDHILLLNNDTEVISPDWMQEMLMYSQRSDVGAVGAKLYYPDHTIQHAGLGIGLLTLAGHYHRHFDGNHPGYMGRLIYAQDLSGVTAACMMLPRHVFEEMNGLDESLEVAFNDVDLCMRIRKAGYLIVFTPFAELWHYESKSRGEDQAPEKRARFVSEVTRFQQRWAAELAAGDPYFNPNFNPDREDFSIRAK